MENELNQYQVNVLEYLYKNEQYAAAYKYITQSLKGSVTAQGRIVR